MSNVTLVKSKLIKRGEYLKEFRAKDEASIAEIDTEDLAVGSNVLVADSTATFKQWNGTEWVKVV